MEKKIDWEEFWGNYRNIESREESDLFFQVGKTIDKKPVPKEMFENMIRNIAGVLGLSDKDVLLEMCCGNGLLTKPLSALCHSIYAFDFTPHLIETAKKFKQRNNIIYRIGDAKADFFRLFDFDNRPNKFLMNDSLGYFTPADLSSILGLMIKNAPDFSFYITGIPSDALKWNFYNTPERKASYLSYVKNGDESNNGMGRWWKNEEFSDIARSFNLKVSLENQAEAISNYRMNALFATT
jgi:hypothetical protein